MDNLFADVELRCALFSFHITAVEPLLLPEQKGSTFRGGLGTALAQLCRDKSRHCRCQNCPESARCPYASLFSNPSSAAQTPPLQAANLPHPFVLRPPRTTQQHFSPGDGLEFQLVLFGKYAVYLPFYIYAFDVFGENGIGKGRGRFRLCRVLDAMTGHEVYNEHDRTPAADFGLVHFSDLQRQNESRSCTAVKLDFVSTTCVLDQNRAVTRLPFDLLVRSLLRRASSLAALYEGSTWELDYHALIERAQKQVPSFQCQFYPSSWERFSSSQNRHTPMEGFMGQVTYQGNLDAFLPLLVLGEYMHVGRKTTFGMGQYMKREIN